MRDIDLIVNGTPTSVRLTDDELLLHAIRNRLGLTGTKAICEVGTCGGCTVLVDDLAVYSCLVLASECDRAKVDTVEGLAEGSELSELQHAFVDSDALQCGYCTPGQLMSLEALRRATDTPSTAEISEAVEGNLCRCGAYTHIIEAAHRAFGLDTDTDPDTDTDTDTDTERAAQS